MADAKDDTDVKMQEVCSIFDCIKQLTMSISNHSISKYNFCQNKSADIFMNDRNT